MEIFCPNRLVLARKRRGLTKKALADAVGVSTRSISAYEAGTQHPSIATIVRLAQVLRFPDSFFSGPDLEDFPLNATSFRALSKMTAKQQHQAISAGVLAASLADWIDDRFSLPEPSVPLLQGIDPETAAHVVRGEWGLGQRSIRNMIHLLEAHGVRVFSLVEECQEVDAFSTWRQRVPYIFLNTMKSSERSRMDAAHELGHLVLHWDHELPRGRNAEEEAKAFASAFLMPAESVIAHAPKGGSLDSIETAKTHWDVAVSALVYRMHKLGMLTEWEYRSLFIEMSKKGLRTSEDQGIARETSQVLDKVFRSLRDEGIGKADVARELNISTEELSGLVFGLTLTALGGDPNPEPVQKSNRPRLTIV